MVNFFISDVILQMSLNNVVRQRVDIISKKIFVLISVLVLMCQFLVCVRLAFALVATINMKTDVLSRLWNVIRGHLFSYPCVW